MEVIHFNTLLRAHEDRFHVAIFNSGYKFKTISVSEHNGSWDCKLILEKKSTKEEKIFVHKHNIDIPIKMLSNEHLECYRELYDMAIAFLSLQPKTTS